MNLCDLKNIKQIMSVFGLKFRKEFGQNFLTNKAVVEALDGLPPQKIHCSVLAEEAIKNALKDYFDKNNF